MKENKELSWNNKEDRLEIIKKLLSKYRDCDICGVPHEISMQEYWDLFNKFAPWMVERIEKLENSQIDIS